MKNFKFDYFRVLIYVCLSLCVVTPAASTDFYAIGDYVQDLVITENPSDLFNSTLGYHFDGSRTYERGDFYNYTWMGSHMTRTSVNLLHDGTFSNIHGLLCYPNHTLASLVNPYHNMKEQIHIDSSQLSYYEPGLPSNCSETLRLNIPKNAVSYKAYTDYIPLKRIEKDANATGCVGSDCYLDFEYRGRITFWGDDRYFVRDVVGDKIYLAQGRNIHISNSGYNGSYKGYDVKVNNLTTSGSGCGIILLDVRKPDGSVVQVQVTEMANYVVDSLEISGISSNQSGSLQEASIIVYDLSSQIILEDGEKVDLLGVVFNNWKVQFATVDNCLYDSEASDGTENDCSVAGYDSMKTSEGALLKSINLIYNHDLNGSEALEEDEILTTPNGFCLGFKGYLNNDFRKVSCSSQDSVHVSYLIGVLEESPPLCSMLGDYPPCDVVSLSEVVDFIIRWSSGQASISDVIDLINAWAGSG